MSKFNYRRCYVFTYWEGNPYSFTPICIKSISRIFGDRHIHITPNNIHNWIDVDKSILDCNHLLFRSDYIRTKLLQKYGGWWFDSDIIIFKDPTESIKFSHSKIWNLVYRVNNKWMPMINCGILYTKPNSPWINKVMDDFNNVNVDNLCLTHNNEDIGQLFYEKHSTDETIVDVGHEHDFNSSINVDADYRPFWNGVIKLNTAKYAIHIGASLSRWASIENNDIDAISILEKDIDFLLEKFPNSIVTQYCKSL